MTHSSNTIIDRIDLPYIWVGYIGGALRDDFPLTGSSWGTTAHGGEKHTFSGGEIQMSRVAVLTNMINIMDLGQA